MSSGSDPLRVALAQINATVGDIAGNAAKIAGHTAAARDEGAALVVFPELSLTGYELDAPELQPDDPRLGPIVEALS